MEAVTEGAVMTLPTVSELLDKLAVEGSSQQIAAALAAQGITGQVGEDLSCPVAVYLQRGARQEVSVGVYVARSYPRKDLYSLPPSVSQFVVDFDLGNYPELVTPLQLTHDNHYS